MTTQLAAFKQEVNNLAEVFSEVEQDLDPNVYKLFSGPLNKVMENMQTCSDHMENMSAVMRLMALLSKRPDIKLSIRNIDLWEERFASGRRAIPDGAMLEPVDPPEEEDEEEERGLTAADPRPTVARAAGIRLPPGWRMDETTAPQPRIVPATPIAAGTWIFDDAVSRLEAERITRAAGAQA